MLSIIYNTYLIVHVNFSIGFALILFLLFLNLQSVIFFLFLCVTKDFFSFDAQSERLLFLYVTFSFSSQTHIDYCVFIQLLELHLYTKGLLTGSEEKIAYKYMNRNLYIYIPTAKQCNAMLFILDHHLTMIFFFLLLLSMYAIKREQATQ